MHCAFCSGRLAEVMDFGDVALAGAFVKPEDFEHERTYPLRLGYCEPCWMLQVMDRVAPSELFNRDYFYHSSAIGTLRNHFQAFAVEIMERFAPRSLVEVGCNDGVLLKPLAGKVRHLVGVDPAGIAPHIPGASVFNEFFTPELARDLGKTDVVVANNVFAHIEDIVGVTAAVRDLLTDDGVFIIEVNRLDSLIADCQYDWVYHEHLYYYSLLALQKHLRRHGLEVFDVKNISTHAGSMRCYIGKAGKRPIAKAVYNKTETEQWLHLDRLDRFVQFAVAAEKHRQELMDIVCAAAPIAGYGACGRANTLIQYCGMSTDHIAYVVDDAPAKHGYYTPGSHIPIKPSSELKADCTLVFAWSFLDEILARSKDYTGMLVVPFPHIKTFDRRAVA